MGPGFRWLLAASWTSNIGDGIAIAAGPLLVASQTDSPLLVAGAAALQYLPWLLFGLHAGAIADRVDRRMLVIVANVLRAVVIGVLCVFIATGTVHILIVMASMFLYGVAEVFADSASSTLLPMLVRHDDLGIANARMQGGYLVANQFAGPPIGAFLFAAGMAWPFLAQVVCVLAAVVLVSRVSLPPLPPREGGHPPVGHDILDGLRWTWRNPPMRTLMLVILVFNITWAAPWGVLVLYATDHLDMGAVGYGALTTASAVGGIASTFAFGWLERHVSFATLMRVCLSLEVLMHLAFALTTQGWIAFVIMIGFGAYAFVWHTISTTVRQRVVPSAYQGRVSSANMVCVFGGMILGQALGGAIAQAWGLTAPWWFAFVGAGVTLLLVWRQLGHIAAARPAAA
jgi:MFS family permease